MVPCMTRTHPPTRTLRTALVAGAALCLLALPVSAQLPAVPAVPDLPVGLSQSTSADTPIGTVSADASERGASACADLGADADAVKTTALAKADEVRGLVPAAPVPLPVALPATPATPTLPAAGADACIDADLESGNVSARACADAERLGEAGRYARATAQQHAPVPLPDAPVQIDDAQACADAAFEDGAVEAGAGAEAGPVQQAFRHTVDALQGAWHALRGLF